MTSEERREARYQRRKQCRKDRQKEGQPCFEDVFSFNNLYHAGRKCCLGVRWKSSVINYETRILEDNLRILDEITSGKRSFKRFNSFTVCERGKERAIDGLRIQDRVPQKCFVNYFMRTLYMRSLIYDNGASLQGRGYHFQIKRLKKHLSDHFRKHGLKGGILQFDFKGYFSSLPHAQIKAVARERMQDDRLYRLFCEWVDDFTKCGTSDGSPRGIGLGSEISQIIGCDYASPIDHLFKDQLGIHGYGRYNDDGYIISDDLQNLHKYLDILREKCAELGITLSEKKCRITPFRGHGFRFLKLRFRLTETGKVVVKPGRKTIRVVRRKMKKLRRWLDDGKMPFSDVQASYQSWRSYVMHCSSNRTLYNMDAFFIKLFGDELRTAGKRFICLHRAYRDVDGWHYTGTRKDDDNGNPERGSAQYRQTGADLSNLHNGDH